MKQGKSGCKSSSSSWKKPSGGDGTAVPKAEVIAVTTSHPSLRSKEEKEKGRPANPFFGKELLISWSIILFVFLSNITDHYYTENIIPFIGTTRG